MTMQIIETKKREFKLLYPMIYIFIVSFLPMLVFSPYYLEILDWPSRPGPILILLGILMLLGPLVLAFLLTAIEEGKVGVKALFGCLWKGRLTVKWLLTAVLIWPGIFLTINLLYRTLGGNARYPMSSFISQPWTYLSIVFLSGLTIVIVEKFGWCAYVLPRLQLRTKAFGACKAVFLFLVFVFLVLASTRLPPSHKVEEITFQSGPFKVVGDLRTPGGKGPYPLVLFVHGDGPVDRVGGGYYLLIMERMLESGYATFAWDKPGTGESTGSIDPVRLIQQRAQIVLDAIEIMKGRPDIASNQIGLWGGSQAGYVMPYALAQSQDIAFMICISCPGMPTYDQMAYQLTALALCDGVSVENVDQQRKLLTDLDSARTYDTYEEYLHYREVLEALAGLVTVPVETRPVLSEKSWKENLSLNRGTWNPIEVIEQMEIPVLAIFGASDRQGDPLQGAYAFRKALAQAGNPLSRVELFPKAGHGITPSETGCPEEKNSVSFGDPFAPGYLDLIEEWLKDL